MKKLYKHRFEIYLSIQLLILFGSIIIPEPYFENYVTPLLFSANILAGTLLISKKKKLTWFFFGLFTLSVLIFGGDMLTRQKAVDEYLFLRLGVYFIFTLVVTWEIIKQVWKEKEVDKKVILGLISGYISLGFLGFFFFMSIDLTHTNAFTGSLVDNQDFILHTDGILYYSFITLLTIGYGEIIPAIPIAQKAAILVGLVGQFYIAIVTAVIVTKYINFAERNR